MFDPDNFFGGIHDSSCQIFKLQKFQAKSRYELQDNSQMQGKLVDFLQEQDKSPILIWTAENDKQDFIVIKKYQGEWYFLNQDSCIYKITKDGRKLIQDLSEQAEEINQQDFLIQHFGPMNIFYTLRVCDQNQRQTDQLLFSMFRLIYQQKQYSEHVSFWADFKQLAELQLKLPDIQNNKFVLPSIKFNRGNSSSNNFTQNQFKQQKKSTTKKRQKQNTFSDDDTEDSQMISTKGNMVNMVTRNKQALQEQEASKRQKQ
ncbi:hypothetical protein OXYTRIMIC_460 [Oxytricha trifallax]|uniref:Uncharacterized protein n=1 Tax=Oxytricha trifallax TaxID=1172189 RepID=A0A073HZX0_9SPIT|nr:hypothetical protein OXYTRIMIC_460 [Oxytricha trifallax]